jgi:signal transduction histidine kinase
MSKRSLKPPSTERLIFWSVAILLLTQMAWWIGVQIRESKRLQEARIAQMRAGRAEAWQFDSMASLQDTFSKAPAEGPGVVVGRFSDTRTFEERRRAIEERFPFVAVLPYPTALDDPLLLTDQTAYLTLRPEVLEAMDRERTVSLWRAIGEAMVLVAAVLIGLTYIYRKLNAEMDMMFRQRNFIASVTHELKTPIASLRVWTETMFSRDLAPAQKVRIQTLMDGDLNRLTDLVTNLLETARADAGRLELRLEATELAPLIQRICQEMDHRLGEGLLGLQMNLAPGILARVDAKAFAMVLENLLSNALKYASEPRETSITLDGDTEDAILVVADRGHGIPTRELPRIFQRFYRVGDEMTRAVPGTGLGLFLCREIVRAHGGEIRVASLGSGLGTTFTIRLSRLTR